MVRQLWLWSFLGLLLILPACGLSEDQSSDSASVRQQAAPTATLTVTPGAPASPTPEVEITPSPTPCTLNPEWEDTYTVRAGDTLGGIAINAGVSVRALQDNNCLENRDLLRVGDVLRVPNAIAINIAISPEGIEGVTVFVRQDEDGTQDLWTVKSDGSVLRPITDTGTVIGRPVRTADGEWIAYRTLSEFYSLEDSQPLQSHLPSNIWARMVQTNS